MSSNLYLANQQLKNISTFQKEQMNHLDTFFGEVSFSYFYFKVSEFLNENDKKYEFDEDSATELHLAPINEAFTGEYFILKTLK